MVSLDGSPLRHPGTLSGMARSLVHRGPDNTGSIILPHAALGASRLRIVDLDARADQPFTSEDHCVSLVMNGEIYNAGTLRREFPRYPFRSRADSEVVLPLYRSRGPAGLALLDGMFAIALWDDGARRLILARDRAGEKPLFYATVDGEVWFASEIQALLQHPALSRTLDEDALRDFLAFGYVREPRTMFRGVRKVAAGSVLVIGTGTTAHRASESRNLPLPTAPATADHEVESRLATLLQQAVRKQLVADVPAGVFLSGGLDSSLLTGIAAGEMAPRQVATFSVRFTARSYDEGAAARAVAEAFGTRHAEIVAHEPGLANAFTDISRKVAEPLADPAILPTYLLARRAREEVGVVLSGEGADELFGGYPAYLGHTIAPLGRLIGPLARWLPRSTESVPLSFLLQRFAEHAHRPWLERHVAWMGTALDGAKLRAPFCGVRGPVPGARKPADCPSAYPGIRLSDRSRTPRDILSQAMHFDYTTYLRDGLLAKIDRATMLLSLEARAPYLDSDLTSFALSLSSRYKIRGLTTKWLLKRAAGRWLPRSVIRRRKHGLSVPVSALLNGALRHEVDYLLDPERLKRQGLLNPDATGQLLSEHRAGNFSVARGLWALVVLQGWIENWT